MRLYEDSSFFVFNMHSNKSRCTIVYFIVVHQFLSNVLTHVNLDIDQYAGINVIYNLQGFMGHS